VRRIEAVTGEGALHRFQEDETKISRVAGAVQGGSHEIVEQVAKVLEEKKSLEHKNQQLKTKLAQSEAGDLESKARDVKGVKVLAARVSDFDRPQLRAMVDSLKNKLNEAVIVLGSATDGTSVSIVAGVTKGLTGKVHAGKLAGTVAAAVGGKGGGRPDMAEAGGKDVAALDSALANVYSTVEGML
jgi:alanyl-tRNA synthetase